MNNLFPETIDFTAEETEVDLPARMLPLAPHTFEPKVVSFGSNTAPLILLTLPAYQDICHIINLSKEEIGWLGAVEKKEDNTYVINRIFLFEQAVSATHCEFDQEALGKFYAALLKEDPAKNRPILNSILFWGHLHPGFGTGPSGQDDAQMELFAHNPYFIRGIFSDEGRAEFTFFDYEKKLKIVDCPWSFYFDTDLARKEEIKAEIKKKVRKGYTAYSPNHTEVRFGAGHVDTKGSIRRN